MHSAKLFVLVCFILTISECFSWKLIPTPFGMMPDSCVHNVGNNATIKPVSKGVEVLHADGRITFLPELPECIEFKNKLIEKKMRQQKRILNSVNQEKHKKQPIPYSPEDGWLDNAGYYPSNDIINFQGNYLVPPDPQTDSTQVLFYFIGSENLVSGETVTIVQPVLTWGNGINGWSFESWNCCPSGQAHNSAPLTGFAAGDTLYGQVYCNNNNWNIISAWGSQNVELTVTTDGRQFNWADVTLETYGVTTCSEFPNGAMVFSNLSMTLSDNSQPTPQWSATGATECGGSLTVENPTTISIQHN